jgi:hypothetical protein
MTGTADCFSDGASSKHAKQTLDEKLSPSKKQTNKIHAPMHLIAFKIVLSVEHALLLLLLLFGQRSYLNSEESSP